MSTPADQALTRTASPWLLICALATTLPHMLNQPLWLSASSLLMLGWAAWLWQHDRRLPGRWPLLLLATAGCAALLLEYRTLLGREAGVAMLVMFMAMKQLELKAQRDATVVVTLAFFLLLTHYFNAQDIPSALWMLLSLWLITATLIRLQGGPQSRWRANLRYAMLLCLQALPLMLALYLLFPRVPGPLWGLPQDAHSGRMGLADSMSPGSIAELAQNGEIAFRVRFETTPPAKSKLYWRGPVLESFDGTTWRTRRPRNAAAHLDALSAPIAYETTLEAHGQPWLLALDAPLARPEKSLLDDRLTLSSASPVDQRQRYRLSAALDYRFNVDESPEVRKLNLRLPVERNPRSQALAREWQRANPAPERIVEQAIAFFASQGFTYTLRPPLTGQNGVDDFLFSTRQGFCEHYAAALVVLMRAAGIPARVVGGYQGGELNPVDGYLIVRQSDAHAWAEVWLEKRGWVRVDPTSVVAPSRLESGIAEALGSGEPLPMLVRADWLRSLRDRWEALNNTWNQQVIGYDTQHQRQLLSRLGLPEADWQTLGALLAGTGSLLLAALAAWILSRRPRHDPAQRLWHIALRHLARRTVDCAPWETPYALQTRVDIECPDLSTAFRQVVEAYLQTRYGKKSNLQSLRDAVARLP